MWSVWRRNDKNVQMMLDSNSFQISRMSHILFLVFSKVLPHHSEEKKGVHKQKKICGRYGAGITKMMFDPNSFQISRMSHVIFLVFSKVVPHHSEEKKVSTSRRRYVVGTAQE